MIDNQIFIIYTMNFVRMFCSYWSIICRGAENGLLFISWFGIVYIYKYIYILAKQLPWAAFPSPFGGAPPLGCPRCPFGKPPPKAAVKEKKKKKKWGARGASFGVAGTTFGGGKKNNIGAPTAPQKVLQCFRRAMKIPNVCLVLKLDNGKVVSIAVEQTDRITDGQNHRAIQYRIII